MQRTMAVAAWDAPSAAGGKKNVYLEQIRALKEVRRQYNLAAQSSGAFQVQEIRGISATERFNNAIAERKMALRDLVRHHKLYRQALNEQVALQNAQAIDWTRQTRGKGGGLDLYIPNNATGELTKIRHHLGYINEITKSIAHQTVNWGKNTQWAGRQIMVGIGMPLTLLAVGAAAAAYQVDKELTRISKVYDTQAQNYTDAAHRQMAVEAELRDLRTNSFNNSVRLANEYGAAVKDTLNTEAQLAATGLSGNDLLKSTAEVTRIATLGEMDRQQALEMTIALQTAFGLSTDELTKKFNFMNSVENATSLSIQDIADATPRAASALAGLGVEVEEMVVLLTAMRERGVNAEEGANALKSATTRILNPVRAAVEEFNKHNIDINEIVERTSGNLFDTLKELSVRMADLDPLERQKAIAKLFGTYQFNRLNAALQGIGASMAGVGDETSQTAKAVEVMMQDSSKWAETADDEMERWAESASGKFQRAIESMKAQLAAIGVPVLNALSPIINAITKVLEAFNNMPDAAKKGILIGALIIAAAGAVTMFIGVLANLAGTFGKALAAMLGLATRMKVLTAEQKAQELSALRARGALGAEAAAAEHLTKSLQYLRNEMARAAAAQGLYMAAVTGTNGKAAGRPGGTIDKRTVYEDPNGQIRYQSGSYLLDRNGNRKDLRGGSFASKADQQMFRDMRAQSEVIEQKSGLTRKHWGGIATSAGSVMMLGSMMGSMVGMSEKWANWMMMGSMALMMVGPSLTGRISTGFAQLRTSMAVATAGAGGFVTQMAKTGPIIAAIGSSMWTMFGPIGLIAAGIAGVVLLRREMGKVQEQQDKINESAKTWASILGYTQTETALTAPEEAQTSLARQAELTRKLRDENAALADELRNASTAQEKKNLALREGIKVALSGGSAENVQAAIRTALFASGLDPMQIDDLSIELSAQVNLKNPDQIKGLVGEQLQNMMGSLMDESDNRKWWERIFNVGGASAESKAAASSAANLFWDQWSQITDLRSSSDFFNAFQEDFGESMTPLFDNIRREFGGQMKTLGDESMTELLDTIQNHAYMTDQGWKVYGLNEERTQALQAVLRGYSDEILTATEHERVMIEVIGKKLGLSDKEIAQMKTLDDLQQRAGRNLMSVQDAQREFNLVMHEASRTGHKVSDAEELRYRNQYRLAAGLGEAKSNQEGFTESTKRATEAINDQAEATQELAEVTADDLNNALRTSYEGAMRDVYAEADRIMAETQQSQLDAIENRGERRIAALEAQQEAREAEFDSRSDALKREQENERERFDKGWKTVIDNRIKGIRDQIEAEREAEDKRKKIFDAEIRRIERLRDMFSRNIDFNVALNSGNLDEAARIASDARAEEQKWSIEDQRAVEETATEKRIKELEKLEDLEKERLENQRDAEREAMEARQEIRAQELENEKKNHERGLEAAKAKIKAETDASIEGARRRHDADKRALEQSLAVHRAYIPTTEAEYKSHVAAMDAMYAKYGYDLKAKGWDWSSSIASYLRTNMDAAATSLRNDIKWREIALQIQNQMASAFNISAPQLIEWLKTGVFPGSAGSSVGQMLSNMGAAYQNKVRHEGGLVFHRGGSPSWSSKDRTGVPRSASPYPSEVPALLKRGEFIVNEKATRANLPLLQSLNARKATNAEGRNVSGSLGMARHTGGMIGDIGGTMIGAAVGKAIAQGIANTLLGTVMDTAMMSFGGMDPNVLGSAAVEQILAGLRMQESSNNYKAKSKISSASGAYQYIKGTWANYGGYREAYLAPPHIQDQRARADMLRAFQRYGNWESAIASHFYPAWAGNKAKWNQSPGKGNPTVWDYVMGVLGKSGFGGGLGGGGFGKTGNWPKPVAGRVSANTAAAANFVRNSFGISSIGTLGQRANKSDHPMGKALDAMINDYKSPGGIAKGNAIAQWFVQNPGAFGTKYVIWRDQINSGSGWRPYTHPSGARDDNSAHRNHVHVSFLHDGGLALPQLKSGGSVKWDNTIANLHKDETVLTAPLSAKLERGIDKIDSGSGNQYHVKVEFSGPVNSEIDVERAVFKAINKRESRNGRSRKVGN